MPTSDSDRSRRIGDLDQRLARVEDGLGLERVEPDTLTRIKALIKNGSNAWFNGIRENPHRAGTREHELWEYGAELARDVSEGR